MFCSVFCSAIPFLLFVSWTWWVCYPRGILPGTRTFRSRSKYAVPACLSSSIVTLVSSAVGCRTYSSAPLSRMSCTVKAPCSPRPCSVHEICTSVTWRTLIVCSVFCSATYPPFFLMVGRYARCFLPSEDTFKPARHQRISFSVGRPFSQWVADVVAPREAPLSTNGPLSVVRLPHPVFVPEVLPSNCSS